MSAPLRLRQLKALHRLVAEVCQLGHDAGAWTSRLAEGLMELFDARVVGLAWSRLPEHAGGFSESEVELHFGMTDEENRLFAETYCGRNNAFKSEFLRRVVNIPASFVTVRRQDVMDDAQWYRLPEIRSVHRRIDIDANLTSFFVSLSLRRMFGIGLHRAWGRPQYTVEDRRRLRRFHVELARAWRHRFVHPSEEDQIILELPTRLRQVWWLLCLGRSEKEISAQLALSPHTVHGHVRRLHRLLGVHSRAELIARALCRSPVEPVAIPSRDMNQFKR